MTREPIYADDWLTIFQGDAKAVLGEMAEQSVHCVITSPPYYSLRSYLSDDDPDKLLEIGQEQSIDEYVQALVVVFRGVWRVLRDDGTAWLNLGDSYAGSGKGAWGSDEAREANRDRVKETYVPTRADAPLAGKVPAGLKAKDLIGVPWRVAFALQADGWYLRSDIIWAKSNGMPSSVTDRPTLSHEHIFLLTKNPIYFYDADAIREPHQPITLARIKYGLNQNHPDGAGIAVPPVRTTQIEGAGDFDTATVTKNVMGERFANPLGRNKRTVWEVATVPYPDAHYAVFPAKLIEPCIKAGTSERGVCPECGAPWRRDVEVVSTPAVGRELRPNVVPGQKYAQQSGNFWTPPTRTELGWLPTCNHEGEPVPATVLDCFSGSGTTAKVAQSLSRRSILIDLNVDYLEQQMARAGQVPMGL